MESTPDFLHVLGLDACADRRAIRHAYARQLKQIDQAADVAGFQALREAYEAALAWAADDTAQRTPEAAPIRVLSSRPVPEEQAAEAMFERLVMKTAQLAAARRREDPDAWRAELVRCLDDDSLVHVGARTGFEERVVHLLCAGWRPGHEALFAAACDVFAWREDPRMLALFGESGALLNQAIEEQRWFDHQAIGMRTLQARLAMRIRWESVPGPAELHYNLTEFSYLVGVFPAFTHVTIGRENVERWRLAYEALPSPDPQGAAKAPSWGVEMLPQLVTLLLVLAYLVYRFQLLS